MIRAKGLTEALGLEPAPVAPEPELLLQTDWERDQESRRQFAEALAALDEDED